MKFMLSCVVLLSALASFGGEGDKKIPGPQKTIEKKQKRKKPSSNNCLQPERTMTDDDYNEDIEALEAKWSRIFQRSATRNNLPSTTNRAVEDAEPPFKATLENILTGGQYFTQLPPDYFTIYGKISCKAQANRIRTFADHRGPDGDTH